MKTPYIMILVTAKNKQEAKRIALGLLEAKLIACANIIAGVESFFWWQGKIDASKEALLLIKTKKNLFEKVSAQIKRIHSYTTPEIIAFPIVKGNRDYLKWLNSSVVS